MRRKTVRSCCTPPGRCSALRPRRIAPCSGIIQSAHQRANVIRRRVRLPRLRRRGRLPRSARKTWKHGGALRNPGVGSGPARPPSRRHREYGQGRRPVGSDGGARFADAAGVAQTPPRAREPRARRRVQRAFTRIRRPSADERRRVTVFPTGERFEDGGRYLELPHTRRRFGSTGRPRTGGTPRGRRPARALGC